MTESTTYVFDPKRIAKKALKKQADAGIGSFEQQLTALGYLHGQHLSAEKLEAVFLLLPSEIVTPYKEAARKEAEEMEIARLEWAKKKEEQEKAQAQYVADNPDKFIWIAVLRKPDDPEPVVLVARSEDQLRARVEKRKDHEILSLEYQPFCHGPGLNCEYDLEIDDGYSGRYDDTKSFSVTVTFSDDRVAELVNDGELHYLDIGINNPSRLTGRMSVQRRPEASWDYAHSDRVEQEYEDDIKSEIDDAIACLD